MTSAIPFKKGLADLGSGAYAFLSGDEGFGLSNAGLVVSKGEALVVDTLYDVRHAQELVEAISPLTAQAPVRYVFNTHTDGDHFFGNQLFQGHAEVVVTEAANELMRQEHADETAALFAESERPGSKMKGLAPLARPFDIRPVRVRPADTTFAGEKALRVGGLDVELHELGPAHTVGDAIAYVPELGVLFAGDLLTRDIIKIVWSGSVPNWVAALDRIQAFGAKAVVAGHGPVLVGDEIGAAIDLGKRFWSFVHERACALYDQGAPIAEAVDRIDVREYPGAHATLPILVTAIYHERDPGVPCQGLAQALESIAARLGA
ncbi:MAG: MBL fold metallo-hydrolase [Segniliparus sp.]|uniref:MBL fold metallo-hydrolase n=1 Tax=Segniliparus sp. TaxID=2804064 RepID=UPI003F382523